MRRCCCLLLLLVALGAVYAQDVAYAKKIVADLSSPAMYGRSYSYRGDSLAAAYLKEEFRRLGVQPLANDYWQPYTVDAFTMEGTCKVSLNGKWLKPYEEFRLLKASRYATEKSLAAAKWKQQHNDVWFFSKETLDTYSPLLAVEQGVPYCVEVLQSALPKRGKVRKLRYELPQRSVAGYTTYNVCGIVKGEVDTMVVFTAHYDHCGMMGDEVCFNGAHDNASGTAAVLDMARMAVQQPSHYTQVFLLFSGEEVGLKGSRYAVEQQLIDLSKVRLLVNIDMFCGGDDGVMIVNANDSLTRPFVDGMEQLNREQQYAKEIKCRNNAANSDHYWFSQHCPAIFLFTLGQRHGSYHAPDDTCEQCGLEHYNDFMKLLLSVVR